ncbi:ImmA/IrrE family metallo-endopeptidase [Rhizobium leguminosarum]|uniref:ImmA/IrrE family metallo-endopeptidase n=1 Tax=Rhizobium leguminosarum TaxID=384 RepID=UPI003F96066C
MSKRSKATIKPALLVWARETAGFDLSTAAEKLDVDEEKLAAWELGEDQPSIPQLRKAAELYKRPLAVLYLPEPPLTFQPMHDFRRLPDLGLRRFTPELTLEIRVAHQRRELALELFQDADEEPNIFSLTTSIKDNPETVGTSVRKSLKVDYPLQSRWRDPRVAFIAWRSRIEDAGVLVFQASRIESAEASGFAIWADTLPVMVVNRKDAYPRRVFSLLHELAHLMLRQSGVSDLETGGLRPQEDERVEAFCNHVAAATLVPHDLLLAEPIVAARGVGRHEWSDAEVQSLSVAYSVSRETIVRRLLTFHRASEDFYGRKRRQYAIEFQQQREREKVKNDGKPIPRNMPRETVADFGKPFVRRVIENYHQDRISLSEVSGYLGVKVRHVPGIERQLGI